MLSNPTLTPVEGVPETPVVTKQVDHSHANEAGVRLRALDGLRFVAALSVAIFHLLAVAGRGVGSVGADIWGRPAKEVFGGPLFTLASYGWVGVPLFFIISGFVISLSSWGRTPSQFAISRLVRLFPAYWFCVVLTSAVVLAYPVLFHRLSIFDSLVNLTMWQRSLDVADVDNVYATLLVEIKFYLLFTVMVWIGLTYRRAIIFCALWSIGAIVAAESKSTLLSVILVPGNSQYFIAGIAFFLMYRFGQNILLWGIVGFSWIIAMNYHQGNLWQKGVGQPYWPAAVLITLCFVAVGLLAMGHLSWLRWRGLTTLGATTYPLYLLHYVIGTTLIYLVNQKLDLPPLVLLGTVLVLFTFGAWLVHRLIERPFAPRFKRALTRGAESIRLRSA